MSYGYQTWLMDVLADEFRGSKGFQVDYVPGFETRGSRHFDPRGVIDHHTGPGAYNALLSYMSKTARRVPPPLCNTATSRPNNRIVRITVVAAGRANHAGRGYLDWTGSNNGNYRSIGQENQNTGRQKWPAQQLEAMQRSDAAILRYLKKNVNNLDFHKTYTSRKVDPVSLKLSPYRTGVENRLSPADPWEEFWMALSPEAKKVGEEFLEYLAGSNGVDKGDSFARQTLKFLREDSAEVRAFVEGLAEMNTNPRTLGAVIVALVREARARGVDISPNLFEQNVRYRYNDDEELEYWDPEDESWVPAIA